jgi:hypothetical protein
MEDAGYKELSTLLSEYRQSPTCIIVSDRIWSAKNIVVFALQQGRTFFHDHG